MNLISSLIGCPLNVDLPPHFNCIAFDFLCLCCFGPHSSTASTFISIAALGSLNAVGGYFCVYSSISPLLSASASASTFQASGLSRFHFVEISSRLSMAHVAPSSFTSSVEVARPLLRFFCWFHSLRSAVLCWFWFICTWCCWSSGGEGQESLELDWGIFAIRTGSITTIIQQFIFQNCLDFQLAFGWLWSCYGSEDVRGPLKHEKASRRMSNDRQSIRKVAKDAQKSLKFRKESQWVSIALNWTNVNNKANTTISFKLLI